MSAPIAVQDRWAPKSICWGCGPANAHGLRIKSFEEGAELVARFSPEPYHHAFPGMLNGGIIGALLDCHSNWAATMHLMRRAGLEAPPCTVTADFHVMLKRPTPLGEVLLKAHVEDDPALPEDRAIVLATLEARWGGAPHRGAGASQAPDGTDWKITATCRGTFVAVKEGHPAFHRW